ncbi:Maf family protein [Methyloferula stellata]|uniref:Maf family protein n=1 Tax=Methyloferula stellata TaxID=876270 RepID=UPI0003A8A3FF|nr:Maf family protein [Methyloferula stellata]
MSGSKALWQNPLPLILASKSAARQALLTSAGLPFEAADAKIDERAVEASLLAQKAGAAEVAAHLARAKALAVSALRPDHLVIGADQVLDLDGRLFAKPKDLAEAAEHLALLSGRTHELHSAFCVARAGRILKEEVPTARLTCRILGQSFIAAYVETAGAELLNSVGAGAVEGLGIHVLEKIEGDHATIMGLPLIPLLQFLREEGSLLA